MGVLLQTQKYIRGSTMTKRLKSTDIDAELQGMSINLTWKCRVRVWVAFLYCCVRSCQTLPLRSELTNNPLRKQRWVHFLTLQFECHNRCNKWLLCNSENGDIAWCNKNNSEWGFCVFFKKEQKPVSFKKTTKKFELKKQQTTRWVVFETKQTVFQPFRDFPLIARFGTSHVTISLVGCAQHT